MLRFFSLLFLLVSLSPVYGTLNQSTKPEKLTVFLEQNPPFSSITAEQKAQGLLVDYWQQWSRLTGIAVEYDLYQPQDLSFTTAKDKHTAYSGLHDLASTSISIEKQRLFVMNSHFYYRNKNENKVMTGLVDKNSTLVLGGLLPQAQQLPLFYQRKNLSYKEYPGLFELINAVYSNHIDAIVLFEGEYKRYSLSDQFLSLLFTDKLLNSANNALFVDVSSEQKMVLEWVEWGNQFINTSGELNLAIEKSANPIWGMSEDIQVKLLFICGLLFLFLIYNRFKRKKDKQFKTLLDDSPYPLVVVSSNGAKTYYLNDEGLSLLATKKVKRRYFFDQPENQVLLSEFINKASHKVVIKAEPIRLLVDNCFHDIEISAKRVYYQGKSAWVCYLKDVNALLQAEKNLTEERALLRKVLDSIPEQILFKSPKGTVIGCNDAWAKAHQTTVVKAMGKRLSDVIPLELLSQQKNQESVVWAGEKLNTQEWIPQKGSELSLINTVKLPLYNDKKDIFALLSIESDLTDSYNLNKKLVDENMQRKKTEIALSKQNTLLSTVFAASLDPIGLLDQEGRVIGANNAFAVLMGYSNSNELLGKLQNELLPEDRSEWAERQNQEVLETEIPLRFDEMIFSEGKKIWYEVSKTPFKDYESDFQGVVIMARDITLYKETEEKLTSEASDYAVQMLNDQLTGIANRRSFDLHFEKLWKESCEEHDLLSLVMCDIDFFKPYNDNYGHQKGDQALLEVAQALQERAVELDYFVARYGGEEFVVLIKGGNATKALKIAEVLRDSIAKANIEHLYSETSNVITMSMGLSSMLPSDLNSMSMLLAEADSAMYAAKKYGRDQISVH